MRKIHCSAINRKIKENPAQFVMRSEYNYRQNIETTANSIADHRIEKPIILLAGPSGAGKTTTALRLEKYLDNRDMETHTISMDDYFHPILNNDEARDENGEIDYESPYRLDIPLLNEHMQKIANCEAVEIPDFDFANQVRRKGKILKRKPNELVVFEGIHALNPLVTGLTNDFASCIYVSVRTRLQATSGKLLSPSYVRLMRRLIRDKAFRARDVMDTIEMFASVERGENEYIMPFKNRAEYQIDTFIPYEVSVYKKFLSEDLKAIADKCGDMQDFNLIINVLDELSNVDLNLVPENSLVREFVGGSVLKY